MSAPAPQSYGAHALLADGRTAALLTPAGEVAWLCWPRVDSDACLLSLLDAGQGGSFRLTPSIRADLVNRDYETGLVLRTEWAHGGGRLVVREALAWGRPALLRVLEATGQPVRVTVRFRPAFGYATQAATLVTTETRLVAEGGDVALAIDGPASWQVIEGTAVTSFEVTPGRPVAVVLQDAAAAPVDALAELEATRRFWRAADAAVQVPPSSPIAGVFGEAAAGQLLRRSAAVLVGLQQRGGGIVAAPVTSLPQWPGSQRTWDYRYSWLRDTSLAALALLRVGVVERAAELGRFLGRLCRDGDLPSLLRVDGTESPPERTLDHLAGFGGARPVRVGNGAAGQFQLDAAGEVLELAAALARIDALPDSLGAAVPHLAALITERWREPDYGIWEIRGDPRRYTHSRVMAWMGLRQAAALDSSAFEAPGWQSTAGEIRRWVLQSCVRDGRLTLHDGDGGPDAALSQAVLSGFLEADDPLARTTLESIRSELLRGRGVDRYRGQPDLIDDPCAPFLFAAFWLVGAMARCGLPCDDLLTQVLAARGPLGLFGEVVDPVLGTPLGNYPQVQSHAALLLL